jgi:hypothetical protein
MTTSKNDITGDAMVSRTSNEMYRKGWDLIFGKKISAPDAAPAICPSPTMIMPSTTFTVKRACANCYGSGFDVAGNPCPHMCGSKKE